MSQTLNHLRECRASQLAIEVDHVIRNQGIDPDHPNARNPQMVRLAQRAIEIGDPLIKPTALYCRLETIELQHERLRLTDGYTLNGSLIGQHLSGAAAVVVVLCTVGHNIDHAIEAAHTTEPALALALDGFGTAAIKMLANHICMLLEQDVAKQGMRTSIPLSPGMIGWPVEQGQAQIFSILDAQSIGMTLNAACVMTPKKSLSFVVGEGVDFLANRNTCEYCAMNETCQYQNHYDPELNRVGPKSHDNLRTRQQAHRHPPRHTLP